MQQVTHKQTSSRFHVGEHVTSKQSGVGVVVGYGESSETPVVFFYSTQELVWTEDSQLKKVISLEC